MSEDLKSNMLSEKLHSSSVILPYGSVMASGGASAVAAACNVDFLILPLLIVSVLQALWIARTDRDELQVKALRRRWSSPSLPGRQVGLHTIPLGLAVITLGFMSWALNSGSLVVKTVAILLFALMWIAEITMLWRFIKSLKSSDVALKTIGGAWFLVPAGLLGVAMATLDFNNKILPATNFVVYNVAALAALLGWILFLIFSGYASLRVLKFGLQDSGEVFWWIWMGCAGLSVAAFGNFVSPILTDGLWVNALFYGLATAASLIAIILCVPVYIKSVLFLFTKCSFKDAASWPPTFSSAVFCFGMLEAAQLFSSMFFYWIGFASGILTLVFWVVTMLWNFSLQNTVDKADAE